VALIECVDAQKAAAKERQNDQRNFEKEHKLEAINRKRIFVVASSER
jgi:hypothetical protein